MLISLVLWSEAWILLLLGGSNPRRSDRGFAFLQCFQGCRIFWISKFLDSTSFATGRTFLQPLSQQGFHDGISFEALALNTFNTQYERRYSFLAGVLVLRI